jgi:hypothetical protein
VTISFDPTEPYAVVAFALSIVLMGVAGLTAAIGLILSMDSSRLSRTFLLSAGVEASLSVFSGMVALDGFLTYA